jgi:phage shock protein E
MAVVALVVACGGGAGRDAPEAMPTLEAAGESQANDAAGAAQAAAAIDGAPAQGDAAAPAVQPVAAVPAAAAEPLILDVRTPEEYAAGHVAGTVHIPLDELERRWAELAEYRDRPVVVYCRTGRRSATAIDLLASKGFSRLENGGGIGQMARRGHRMVPEDCC